MRDPKQRGIGNNLLTERWGGGGGTAYIYMKQYYSGEEEKGAEGRRRQLVVERYQRTNRVENGGTESHGEGERV